MTSAALHVNYRPQKLEDVIGHDSIVKSLPLALKKGTQSFLLTGPSGVGKTTLARIAARMGGCSKNTITEVNAASHTGVDDMRGVLEMLQFRPFGEVEKRAIILDECHMLSKSAWNSLLKAVEEPPEFILWFLCTTDPTKVPATIKTRCVAYHLKLLQEREIRKIVAQVAKQEGIKLREDIFSLVCGQAAGGSPRQALTNLATCREASTKKEASDLLRSALESEPTLELCKFLVSGSTSWLKAMEIYGKLADEHPEGVRIQVCNYLAVVLKNSKTEKSTLAVLSALEHFSVPLGPEKSGLLLAIGRVLYSE